jgi:serine/threonine protein phosphatase 1
MREHLNADETCWEKTLVCGHTPLRDMHMSGKLICIDTGLHYYGRLSAIDVKSKEVFQVNMG